MKESLILDSICPGKTSDYHLCIHPQSGDALVITNSVLLLNMHCSCTQAEFCIPLDLAKLLSGLWSYKFLKTGHQAFLNFGEGVGGWGEGRNEMGKEDSVQPA